MINLKALTNPIFRILYNKWAMEQQLQKQLDYAKQMAEQKMALESQQEQEAMRPFFDYLGNINKLSNVTGQIASTIPPSVLPGPTAGFVTAFSEPQSLEPLGVPYPVWQAISKSKLPLQALQTYETTQSKHLKDEIRKKQMELNEAYRKLLMEKTKSQIKATEALTQVRKEKLKRSETPSSSSPKSLQTRIEKLENTKYKVLGGIDSQIQKIDGTTIPDELGDKKPLPEIYGDIVNIYSQYAQEEDPQKKQELFSALKETYKKIDNAVRSKFSAIKTYADRGIIVTAERHNLSGEPVPKGILRKARTIAKNPILLSKLFAYWQQPGGLTKFKGKDEPVPGAKGFTKDDFFQVYNYFADIFQKEFELIDRYKYYFALYGRIK